ncbi:hypothetical protein SUGI_0750280 [Cryptomeria japonica]|uniref:COP1-interacting protein 7 n=1 Tax=Cryptomeria japonica TaxID=3369 RepID=UPI0024148427|nr:COP1-interacting protein 7 [Cryptomeria japonica]XP_057872124.2 COP1-interacting protein 7 [Cryptomeria japonica]GLJ37028.1 hypothetical protein SUGI_0750280 [Cryptomeria japonica]
MKGDTVLAYAAFQLYPGQTRCEVVLSGGGETEKLNPVLLEALIAHLPPAKELANEAEHVFKLELRDDENAAPWFTKGTMERFIRFVSTPEVLERPNVLHAEMVQLETARKLPPTLYSQVDGGHLSSTGLATELSTPGAAIKSRTETMLADASRNELLRALDVRLMTLHQELDKAFARATAAEFLVENTVDLLAFSERFQASRLRDACTKFLISCQQRQQHFSLLQKNADACFSGLGIPLDNKRCGEPSSKHSRKQDDKPNESTVEESRVSQSHADQQDEQESCFSSRMDNFDAKLPESCTTETEASLLMLESNNIASIGFEQPASDKDNRSPAPTRRPSVRSASPARARRSASPMRKVQIGKSGSRRSNVSAIQFINYMPQWSNRERDSNRESESSDTDNESDGDDEKLECPPKTVSTRTISVQDAINLFERKQREQRHSTEGLKKNINAESRRLSAETGNSTTHEKAILRRWSGASEVGKLDVPNSAKHLLVIGKDKRQVEITPQSELKQMEERKDVGLGFSSTPEIIESQIMQAEQMQGIISQHSEDTGSLEINFLANNFQIQGSGTTDNFPYGVSPENEPTVKQFRSSHELNQLLQEKANQLEAFFAAHKGRSQAAEEGSNVPPSSKLHAKDEASMELKSSDVNSSEPRSLDKLHAGSPGEMSLRKGMFPGTDIDLDQQLRTMQSFGKDSVYGSWSNSADFDMQTLMEMVDGNCYNYEEQLGALDNNKFSDELRGKFYDQYRQKREAKLREEHTAKKSEKEAKLKAMQEVLERRKTEMAGKYAKSSVKRDPLQSQSRGQKSQSSKTKLSKNKKELHKNNEDNGDSTNDLHERSFHQKNPNNRGAPGEIPSPTSTPRLPTDLPKSNGFRKISSKSTTSAIAQSSSPMTSSSPRAAIPKVSSTSNASTGRRKSQSLVGGNPLARSMPNLADLKKESSKTLSGRSNLKSTLEKGAAMPRGKNKGSSQNKSGTEPPHLDVNGSSCGSQSSHSKEEKKNRSHPRKGLVGGKELKSLSAITSEESALTSKPSFYSKVTKKNSVVPLESKPFLRKGNGIGPGVGRGISKMKASSLDDVPKTVEDECQVVEENIKETVLESGNSKSSDTMEGTADENKPDQQGNGTLDTEDALGDLDTLEKHIYSMPDLSKIEDVYENGMPNDDRHIQTVSEVSNTSVSPAKTKSSSSATKQECDEQNISTSEIILNEYDIKPSLEAEVLVEPPPSAALAQLAPSGLNSELGNPISLKSRKPHSLSQMLAADTDEEKTRQKWGSAQKPILDPQYSQKDAPKGFKRLLKFGRKNRSEMGTTDSLSGFPFAEGDEGIEELKEPFRRNANNLQRGQVQAKAIRPGNASSDRSYDFQSTNSSVHSIQSSVLQDEHLTGSTLLKAPRSFFSLSTFRSRGSDSKSR